MYADQTPGARAAPGGGGVVRTAVLGPPAGDRLSPALHRAAYAAMGLGGSCEAVECEEPALPALLGSLGRDRTGLCLAVPLTRAVLPLLDEVSDLAMDVGGADTVILRRGRSFGDHTGVHAITAGLLQAGLQRAGPHRAGLQAPGSAVVLGGGAEACAALAALREVGVREPVVVVEERTCATEVEAAAARLGVSVELHHFGALHRLLRDVAVVVSTLPAGAADALAPAVARSGAAVLDSVCSAWPTRLVKAAGFTGGTAVDGVSVLLHRTARQVELLTGRKDVPPAAMRRAALAGLTGRAARDAEPARSCRPLTS